MNHKVTVLVLIADGVRDSTGESMTVDAVEHERYIPLKLDYDKAIGQAKPFWEGDRLYAELTLFGDSLKALGIDPSVVQLLTPSVGGKKKMVVNGAIKECVVNCVSLSASPNADSRVVSIANQKIAFEGKPKC